MKLAPLAATAALLGAPAFAHGGAHLHPHNMEFTVAGLAVVTVAALIFALRR